MNARNTPASRARRLASMNTAAELSRRLAELAARHPGEHESAAALRAAIEIKSARSQA